VNSGSDIKKVCPKCLDKGSCKVQPGDINCRNCCERLVEEPRIQEITDQEAQEIQHHPFFSKPKGS